MKFLLLIVLLLTCFTATAELKRSPFQPHDDKRFDELERAGTTKSVVFDWTPVTTLATAETVAIGVLPSYAVILNTKVFVETQLVSANDTLLSLTCKTASDLLTAIDISDIAAGQLIQEFIGTANHVATDTATNTASFASTIQTGSAGCTVYVGAGAGDGGDVTDAGINSGTVLKFIIDYFVENE